MFPGEVSAAGRATGFPGVLRMGHFLGLGTISGKIGNVCVNGEELVTLIAGVISPSNIWELQSLDSRCTLSVFPSQSLSHCVVNDSSDSVSLCTKPPELLRPRTVSFPFLYSQYFV